MLAKQSGSIDNRAARVLKPTVQEQGIMKYHASSCYRTFQRDMAKIDCISQPSKQTKLSQQCPIECIARSEPCSKRFKPSTAVCIIRGSDKTTVKWKTVHTLYRISEKAMVQKLLNAAMLFKDRVYTERAAMYDVGYVFAADILHVSRSLLQRLFQLISCQN